MTASTLRAQHRREDDQAYGPRLKYRIGSAVAAWPYVTHVGHDEPGSCRYAKEAMCRVGDVIAKEVTDCGCVLTGTCTRHYYSGDSAWMPGDDAFLAWSGTRPVGLVTLRRGWHAFRVPWADYDARAGMRRVGPIGSVPAYPDLWAAHQLWVHPAHDDELFVPRLIQGAARWLNTETGALGWACPLTAWGEHHVRRLTGNDFMLAVGLSG